MNVTSLFAHIDTRIVFNRYTQLAYTGGLHLTSSWGFLIIEVWYSIFKRRLHNVCGYSARAG